MGKQWIALFRIKSGTIFLNVWLDKEWTVWRWRPRILSIFSFKHAYGQCIDRLRRYINRYHIWTITASYLIRNIYWRYWSHYKSSKQFGTREICIISIERCTKYKRKLHPKYAFRSIFHTTGFNQRTEHTCGCRSCCCFNR